TVMTKRRGKGEGSIRKRTDGRWEARIDCGWIDGKRVRKSIFGRTRREVTRRLPNALQQAQRGMPFADERQTVERYLTRWLRHMQTRIRGRTWATYETAVRLHLSPGIGKVAVAKLTPAHLEAWFQQLQNEGTSANRIRYARTVLRAALNR